MVIEELVWIHIQLKCLFNMDLTLYDVMNVCLHVEIVALLVLLMVKSFTLGLLHFHSCKSAVIMLMSSSYSVSCPSKKSQAWHLILGITSNWREHVLHVYCLRPSLRLIT